MARRLGFSDMVLDIIKAIAIAIVGFIIIRALIQATAGI